MSVRARLVVIVAVVIGCVWAIYPPAGRMKLGLDLKGGVELVLRVNTTQAVQLETRLAAERMRSALAQAGVAFTSVETATATEFHVEGAMDETAFRAAAAAADPPFVRERRGERTVFRMTPSAEQQIRTDTVQQALAIIERRVNELGVSEPVVARYVNADEIFVQLPGVSDVEEAKGVISSTAQLQLTLVERGPFPSAEAARAAYDGTLPATLALLTHAGNADAADSYYVVHATPAVAGADVRDARQALDEFNRPAVAFTLTPEAGARFGAFTAQHVNRTLATVLNGRITSVATIVSRIDDRGQIVGVTREEMLEQVITLKSGALPADLEIVEEQTVGASLGAASVRSGILASAGGLALVALFMLAYYGAAGLNALVAIVINLAILVSISAIIPITLTLPGIAGLILTIGMGVDSNVLIFERIKEEVARARGARAAVAAGFDRVWITIVDTHVTSLIAAAVLFQFGTGAIQGFALTLAVGLLANVFTSVFVSRTLFELLLWRRRATPAGLSISTRISRLTNTAFNFTRWTRAALVASLLVTGAGALIVATRGLPLGIDFSGGTALVVEFDAAVADDAVRDAVAGLPGDEVVQGYGPADERRVLIRRPLAAAADTGQALDAAAQQVTHALSEAALPDFTVVKRNLVSASVGEDLQRRGLYAVAASMAAVTAYVAARFRWSFAIGAMAATVHDVLVTVACLSFAGYDLTLNVTAALLTIVGYSVNDTIVVFDRVRENRLAPGAVDLATVVNLSVNQTLARTCITAGTTLLSVVALYVFGGDALRGFAFTMLVGIVCGTYSTVFIASAIATRLGGRTRRA